MANPKSGIIQTDAEIEAYQHAHVKIPEIGGNGEYILEDGTPLRQYGILNYEQPYEHAGFLGLTGKTG